MNTIELYKTSDTVLFDNVFGKLTQNNVKKTANYIKTLYSIDQEFTPFRLFCYFWKISDQKDRALIAFLFAMGMDYLLYESVDIVCDAYLDSKVSVESIQANIEKYHPNVYSIKTGQSTAKNLASSCKQAGLLLGKVKNIKGQLSPTYISVAFAYLMAYLNDDRGEFILQSKWVRILGLGSTALRDLAVEASLKGLMDYKYAGSVVTINFNNLFTTLGLYGVES